MACVVTLLVGSNSFVVNIKDDVKDIFTDEYIQSLDVEGLETLISNSSFVESQSGDNLSLDEFLECIKNNYLSDKTKKFKYKLGDLLKENAIATFTLKELKEKYSDRFEFPQSEEFDDIQICYFTKYSAEKNIKFGKAANGIFILDYKHLENFLNYLIIKEALNKKGKSNITLRMPGVKEMLLKIKEHRKNIKIPNKELVLEQLKTEIKKQQPDLKEEEVNKQAELEIETQEIALLIDDYLNNKSKYIFDVEKKLAKEYLGDFCKIVLDINNRRKYSIDILTRVNESFDILNDEERVLSFTKLHNELKDCKEKDKFKPIFKLSSEASLKKPDKRVLTIKDLYKSTLTRELFDTYFKSYNIEYDENKTVSEYIFDILRSLDRDFAYSVKEVLDSGLLVKTPKNTLLGRYEIGFDEIANNVNEPENYRGYYIFEDNTGRIFVTRYYTTEKLITSKFNSKNEARNYIDKKVGEKEMSMWSFHQFHDPKNRNINGITHNILGPRDAFKGKVLHLLDIDLDTNSREKEDWNKNYREIINAGTDIKYKDKSISEVTSLLSDILNKDTFFELDFNGAIDLLLDGLVDNGVVSEDDFKKLDTPEKIYLFCYNGLSTIASISLDEYKKNPDFLINRLKHVVNSIITSKSLPYVVVDTHRRTNSDNISIDLLKVPEIGEYKKDETRTVPVRLYFEKFAEGLEKLGVKVHLYNGYYLENSENITDEEKEILRLGLHNKAFLSGNEIYIDYSRASDESDLFHEYSHIVLGILKVHNPDLYNNLITAAWKKASTNDRTRIFSRYKDNDMYTQMEEYFAYKMGNYFNGSNILDEDVKTGISSVEGAIENVFGKVNLSEIKRINDLCKLFGLFMFSGALFGNNADTGFFNDDSKKDVYFNDLRFRNWFKNNKNSIQEDCDT